MHRLAVLLQYQVAGDITAFQNLPHVLSALRAEDLAASPHRTKWILRVNSLLHSKEPAARWTGLCLARRSAELNQELLTEHAHTWVTSAMSMLAVSPSAASHIIQLMNTGCSQRNETTPIYRASGYLLFCIFTAATHLSEFQRLVSLPSVPKFVSAMLALSDKTQVPTYIEIIIRRASQQP